MGNSYPFNGVSLIDMLRDWGPCYFDDLFFFVLCFVPLFKIPYPPFFLFYFFFSSSQQISSSTKKKKICFEICHNGKLIILSFDIFKMMKIHRNNAHIYLIFPK